MGLYDPVHTNLGSVAGYLKFRLSEYFMIHLRYTENFRSVYFRASEYNALYTFAKNNTSVKTSINYFYIVEFSSFSIFIDFKRRPLIRFFYVYI